jgi:hypothetical protein
MKRVLLACAATAGLLAVLVAPAAAQPADEHAAATAIVAQLAADTAHQTVTADALLEARNALERATRLRVAGDEAHAKAADGLALEWAETARDVVRAADAEAASASLRHKALDAQAQLERSQALVEEAVASIGRLQSELDQASAHAGQSRDHTAVEVHDGDPPAKGKDGKRDKTGGKKAAPKKDVGGTP